jgi:uncharacterized protein YoxC
MAIRSFEELMEGLRANPSWQAQMRAVLLGDEVLGLPAAVAALTGRVDDVAGQMATLTQRVDTLTQRVDDLAGRVDALTQQVDTLTQRVDDLAGRVDALTQRVDTLTQRVDDLTQQIAVLTRRLDAFIEHIDERLSALVTAQETTEARLQGLAEQLSAVSVRADRAIGYMLELQYRGKAHAYFQTIARRIRVLDPEELDSLLDAALEAGQIEGWEAEQVRWADAVIRGRRDDQPILMVVEVSVAVDRDDVQRAADRAEILSRTGTLTLAVAAGDTVIPTAAPLARERSVWLVTDGRVEAPAA